jgi:predicted DNA-binding protein YlxM (UPF0122 family)
VIADELGCCKEKGLTAIPGCVKVSKVKNMAEKINDIEKMTEMGILYDFYGMLLPGKQRNIFALYYEDDYSLSEIGEELGITRQGVHDFLKRGENRLNEYESKLGLVKRFGQMEQAKEKAMKAIDLLAEEFKENNALTQGLKDIKKMIETLD